MNTGLAPCVKATNIKLCPMNCTSSLINNKSNDSENSTWLMGGKDSSKVTGQNNQTFPSQSVPIGTWSPCLWPLEQMFLTCSISSHAGGDCGTPEPISCSHRYQGLPSPVPAPWRELPQPSLASRSCLACATACCWGFLHQKGYKDLLKDGNSSVPSLWSEFCIPVLA